MRTSFLVVLVPLFILAFTTSRSGPLPLPTLPPSFDGPAATALARELATKNPSRVPGTPFDDRAAQWFSDTLGQYGLHAQSDVWRARVAGLGTVRLRNVSVVVPGSGKGAIAFVAHRDTSGVGMGANGDATGTAALIQLARAYSAAGTATPQPKPLHTLVFVSTDAGAWGGLGAERFARTSPLRKSLLAVVVLDGLGGGVRPRLDTSGDGGRAPAPALVRTTVARVREQTGAPPRLPGLLRQLVDLGLPFAFGDQAPFLGTHIAAIRLTTADDSGRGDLRDRAGAIDASQVAQLGAAAQSLLGSLDANAELAQGSDAVLDLGGRFVRGWALSLVLISLLVPFLAGTVDLVARTHRLGAPLLPALRALRRRVGFWLVLAGLVWFGAAVGFLPGGPARPLAPHGAPATDWPLTGLAVLTALGLLAWFVSRRRLVPRHDVDRPEELAGYAAALAGLSVVAVAVAIAHPLALLFVVPSLYAWLWLPQLEGTVWLRDGVFGVGLAGALAVLVSVGDRFALGARTPLYLLELVSTGYIPWTTVLLTAVWGAVATQLGTLCVGRYGAYAEGVAHPPRGLIRETVRRVALTAQSRRR